MAGIIRVRIREGNAGYSAYEEYVDMSSNKLLATMKGIYPTLHSFKFRKTGGPIGSLDDSILELGYYDVDITLNGKNSNSSFSDFIYLLFHNQKFEKFSFL
jgi:hypothetical protein